VVLTLWKVHFRAWWEPVLGIYVKVFTPDRSSIKQDRTRAFKASTGLWRKAVKFSVQSSAPPRLKMAKKSSMLTRTLRLPP